MSAKEAGLTREGREGQREVGTEEGVITYVEIDR